MESDIVGKRGKRLGQNGINAPFYVEFAWSLGSIWAAWGRFGLV